MMAQRFLIGTTAILSLAIISCAGNSGLAPVTGKVTYQGKPVPEATIVFVGEGSARPAIAISAADGTYSLRTLDANGAAPGNYMVVVTKTELPAEAGEPPSMEEAANRARTPPPPPKRLLPAKYGDATTTPLKFEVKLGQKNEMDIQLAD